MEKRKVIYARYSTAKQDNGVSIDTQLNIINSIYQVNSDNALILIDKAKSGSNANRKAYQELLTIASNTSIDLYVYRLDRLNRNQINMLKLKELLLINNSDIHVCQGSSDIHDVNGSLMFSLETLLAEHERNVCSKRTKDAMMLLHKQGKYIGGLLPLGVSYDSDKNYYYDDNIEIVKDIFRLYYEDMYQMHEIREYILLKYNYKASLNYFYGLIKKEIYLGYRTFSGVRVKVIKKPLFSQQQLDKWVVNRNNVMEVAHKVRTKHSYLFNDNFTIDNKQVYVETKKKRSGKVYKYYRGNNFMMQEYQITKMLARKLKLDFNDDIQTKLQQAIDHKDYQLAKKLIKQLRSDNTSDMFVPSKVEYIKVNSKNDTLTFGYDGVKRTIKGVCKYAS